MGATSFRLKPSKWNNFFANSSPDKPTSATPSTFLPLLPLWFSLLECTAPNELLRGLRNGYGLESILNVKLLSHDLAPCGNDPYDESLLHWVFSRAPLPICVVRSTAGDSDPLLWNPSPALEHLCQTRLSESDTLLTRVRPISGKLALCKGPLCRIAVLSDMARVRSCVRTACRTFVRSAFSTVRGGPPCAGNDVMILLKLPLLTLVRRRNVPSVPKK
jgi:hypothetical protein